MLARNDATKLSVTWNGWMVMEPDANYIKKCSLYSNFLSESIFAYISRFSGNRFW